MILNNQNLCHFCDPIMVKTFHLAKQKEIKSLLDSKKIKYSFYDRIIDTNCGKERPDFVFDCKTHFVVLEVDENQHTTYNKNNKNNKNNQYDCETVRMINISQSLGLTTVFIRYNSDSYKINGIIQKTSKQKKHTELLKCINTMSNQDVKQLAFLSIIYLFYDDYDETKCELEEIKLCI